MTSSLRVQPTTSVQVADYPSRATFGPRRLSDHELVWILHGSAVWTTRTPGPDGVLRDQDHLLTPGMIALARLGTIDSYQWDAADSSRHAYVHFRIAEPGHLAHVHHWPATRSMLGVPILEGLCSYLLELSGQQSDQARARSDELVGLLLDLFVTGPLGEPQQLMSPWLTAVVQHVRAAWEADGMRLVEVRELAGAAGVSDGHLHRRCRRELGCGPARVLELVRLARAATLLQRSNATLAEIAELTGFANAYHFSRRFAQAYGLPPGSYRVRASSSDPLEPVRVAGLLPVARAMLSTAER